MSTSSTDKGVASALIHRFESQRLPRALELKARVDKGETLTDSDVSFLEDVFRDAQSIKPMVARNPEWGSLVAQATDLYHQITTQALENEKKARGSLI